MIASFAVQQFETETLRPGSGAGTDGDVVAVGYASLPLCLRPAKRLRGSDSSGEITGRTI